MNTKEKFFLNLNFILNSHEMQNMDILGELPSCNQMVFLPKRIDQETDLQVFKGLVHLKKS